MKTKQLTHDSDWRYFLRKQFIRIFNHLAIKTIPKKILVSLIAGALGLSASFGQPNRQRVINENLYLISIDDSVFIHVSHHQVESYGMVSSNGLIVIKNGQAIMVDTPMDNEKTEKLTTYLQDSMHVKVSGLIIGHFHEDCLGGLGYLQEKGVKSIAHELTVQKCNELNLPIPTVSFTDSLVLQFNGEKIVCRYFGVGHAADNITVWLPRQRILFGGCLIKSVNSKNLGNLSDAVMEKWDETVEKILQTYPDLTTVIPGHGNAGGIELLKHTIELVKEKKAEDILAE